MEDIRSLLEKGCQHHQEGRLRQAEEFYRRALQADPDNPDGLNLLAVVANETGRAPEAIEWMEKAVRAAPGNPEFSNNLGQLYKNSGQVDEAIEAYRAALNADPDFADAHNNLGNALAMTERLEDAIGHYRRALEIDPNNVRAHYNLATTLSKQGNPAAAIEGLRTVVGIAPDHTDAYNNLGIALHELGRFDEAADNYHKALTLRPDYAEVHNNLGNTLIGLGRLDEAVASYHKAIAIKPDYAEAHYNLGKALCAEERQEDAMAAFGQVLEIDPDHAQALMAMGTTLFEQQQFEDAGRYLLEAAERDTEFNIGHVCLLGDEYRARAKPERFDEVVGKMPEMTGTLPKTSGTAPVIMSACDHHYFREFGRALTLSVDRFAPGHDLHFHIMSPEPSFDDERAALQNALRETALTVTTEAPPEADRLYYHSARFVRLCQIMEKTGRDFLHLDTDSLVRGPFRSVGNIDAASDIAIPMRFDAHMLQYKVLISTLFVRNQPAAMGFMRRFGAYLGDRIVEGKLAWGVDQVAFYVIYRMMQFDGEDIRVVDLPKPLCDHDLEPESDIWALKGGLKQDAAYDRECAKLFEAASLPAK